MGPPVNMRITESTKMLHLYHFVSQEPPIFNKAVLTYDDITCIIKKL